VWVCVYVRVSWLRLGVFVSVIKCIALMSDWSIR